MGGGKKQTIGYRYYFSLHMGLGRGPINEIAQIRVGDIPALDTPIEVGSEGKLTYINKPDLFGGEKKEGGIQGPLFVYNGARDQELIGAVDVNAVASSGTGGGGLSAGQIITAAFSPTLFALFGKGKASATRPVTTLPSIAASLGGDVPSFRGVVSVWFDGLVCAMNPYPKEWSFRVRRSTAGWFNDTPWYPAKARVVLQSEQGGVIHAMNGAHILWEVNTNPEWGRGMPAEMIDENSFIAAANQLCDEGFGLCIPWFRQENIKEFIPVVINHIGGVQYVDRETGKLTLRLIRGDYIVEDLPLFTPDTGLIDIQDDDSSGEETSYNEVVVKGFDPSTKEDISIRVQNLASIQSQEEIISNTIEYRGLPTRELCARVAQRELKVQLPLRKMSVILDRRGWRIAPGMPFRISHPAKGIQNLVLRAGECNDGTLPNGQITIKAVQDIFGMPATSFVTPAPGGWTPPSFEPVPTPESFLYELNWRDYYLRSQQADRDAVDVGTSFVAELAKDPPGVSTQGFDIASKLSTEEEYVLYSNGGFTAWMILDSDIGPLDEELTLKPENIANFMSEYVEGMVVMIDDEHIQLVEFDEDTRIGTLKRGVADTIPAPHLADKTVWLIDDEMVSDNREYQDGEIVNAKALTRTTTGLLDPALAVEDTLEVNQRVFRAYPPGDVKVDGVSVYLERGIASEPVLTWAHRDRIMQQDFPIDHREASIGPEPGVSYRVRIFAEDGVTLLSEHDAGSVDTWTYDSAMQLADGNPVRVVMELESVRDELASQFHYRFEVVVRGGWGYGWGDNWGGG